MRLLAATTLLLASACIADVTYDVDADGDGLLDSEELDWGTDPGATDSDGDGFTDGDEVAQNTDPADEADKPYQAGWPIDACRYDYEDAETGTSEGDIAANFALPDQFGETVRLHDFCGQVVLVMGAGFT